MEKYSVQIIWSDEEKVYVSTSPEMPELTQRGGTAIEAVKKLDEAIMVCLAEKLSRCEALPAPRCLESYSGQFRLRLPRVLHATLARDAETEGVSLNTYIVHILSERHVQNQVRPQVAAINRVEVRKTVQHAQLVSNVTILSSSSFMPGFSWRNASSGTITQGK